MRPIDADELKYTITQIVDISEKTEDDIVAFTVLKVMAETFLEVIDRTPILPEFCLLTKRKYDCNHDCDALYEAYKKGVEDALKGRAKDE